MPIYEYVCEKCGQNIEKLVAVSGGTEEIPCSCGGIAKRKISLSSFQLKGGGWYRSDYKKQSKQECPAKTDSPACNCCANNSEAHGS
jgi:putative FmdB family regulatory protein